MIAPPGAPRTAQIHSPSSHREGRQVARAAFFLLYVSALLISARPRAEASADTAPMSPWERRFVDLDPDAQRVYRAVREGMTEAEARRGAARAWPTVEALAAEGIPPFAADPIDRAGYRWAMAQDGTVVNYLGTPAPSSGRPTVVVIVAEPAPGTAIDPRATADDVHHRLADGTMIHVTVWLGDGLAAPTSALAVLPIERGWTQILTTPPPSR